MLTLSAKIREERGKRLNSPRRQGLLPAVLYGPKVKNLPLLLNMKEFEKIYEEAGESSMLTLKVETGPKPAEGRAKKPEEFFVLIKEVMTDPLTEKFLHVDFYQPRLEEKVEVTVSLVFMGEAPAVRELGGILVKNISEVEVKGLPQNLPKEIRVDVSNLKTFEDTIHIKDLHLPSGVEILKEPIEVVAMVAPPEKEEEVKPVEEVPAEEKEIEKPEEAAQETEE